LTVLESLLPNQGTWTTWIIVASYHAGMYWSTPWIGSRPTSGFPYDLLLWIITFLIYTSYTSVLSTTWGWVSLVLWYEFIWEDSDIWNWIHWWLMIHISYHSKIWFLLWLSRLLLMRICWHYCVVCFCVNLVCCSRRTSSLSTSWMSRVINRENLTFPKFRGFGWQHSSTAIGLLNWEWRSMFVIDLLDKTCSLIIDCWRRHCSCWGLSFSMDFLILVRGSLVDWLVYPM
jgi:hypothetical protein